MAPNATRRRPRLAALALIALPWLPACGDSGPEVARVSGKVTYRGQPVTRGNISFQPVDPGGTPANGRLGPDGSYTLQTFEPGDGARPGDYRVAITTLDESQVLDYIPKGKKKPPKPKSEVPEKYADPGRSGLSASVKSGRNDIPFELQ